MIARYFLQQLAFLFIIFGLIIPAQFAYATPPVVQCYQYGFNEIYSVDKTSLPKDVSFESIPAKAGFVNQSFLKNSSSNHLIIDFNVAYRDKIKLVDGGVYRKINDMDWYAETRYFSSLYALVHINKEIPNANAYNSNEKPQQQIDPVHFSIAAQYNDRPITITGTVSYVLTERDCTAKNSVTPRPKGLWNVILEFFASFKFW